MRALNRLSRFLNWKKPCAEQQLQIKPKCLQGDSFHFIGADGIYYPCCFARSYMGRKELRILLPGSQMNALSIRKYRREEILASKAWGKIVSSFYKNPMPTCLNFCPKEAAAEVNWGDYNGVNSTKFL